MRSLGLVLVLAGLHWLSFQIGRSYERGQSQVAVSTCQAEKQNSIVALQGCEEANHIALSDAEEAKTEASACKEFFDNLNNLGELLAP